MDTVLNVLFENVQEICVAWVVSSRAYENRVLENVREGGGSQVVVGGNTDVMVSSDCDGDGVSVRNSDGDLNGDLLHVDFGGQLNGHFGGDFRGGANGSQDLLSLNQFGHGRSVSSGNGSLQVNNSRGGVDVWCGSNEWQRCSMDNWSSMDYLNSWGRSDNFNGRSGVMDGRSGKLVTISGRSSNMDGGSFVGNGDGGADVLNDWGNGGIGVSFLHRVGKVASQTVRADDGAVVARSAEQSRRWDHKTLASNQTHEENCYLKMNKTITFAAHS